MRKEPATPLVAVVIDEQQSPFELAVACEVFGIDRSEDTGVDWYRFAVCAPGGRPVRASTGFTIHPDHGLGVLRRAHTIIVPAPGRPKDPSPELVSELQRAHRRGARIVSICAGAFVLAHAGLLDGRRATTHWKHSDELAARFPLVEVDHNVLYVDDGDILTSAGTAAGIDLCLHLVRLDHGAEVANIVARRMVVPPHRDGGQAQFVNQPVPCAPSSNDAFAAALEWAQAHLDEPLTVATLARRAAMSPRTFARRFAEVSGTTPHHWLSLQRVLLAQRLLERTDLSVDAIATHCGLGTAANLRLHFQRHVRVSPSAYRRCFQETATA